MAVNTIYNGGYQTGAGTVSTVTLTGAVTGAGSVLTAGAGVGWVNNGNVTGTITAPNSHFNNGNGQTVMTIPYGEDKVVIEEKAELEIKGRVKINGEFLHERLERIESVLNIPTRDISMENKYPKLKELWAAYNRELAKYKTWDNLKGEE